MGKMQNYQVSFAWGETSSRLLSRIDLDAYKKSTKTMLNAYPFIHGGATRRRGTKFLGELYNSAQKARIIPFIFSSTSKFLLIFNGGKIEFVKNGEWIETSPGVTYKLTHTYTESELKDIRYAQSGNTMWLVHPNHPPRILQRLSDAAWTISDITFIYNAVTDVTFENAWITFKIISGSTPFVTGQYFTVSTNGSGGISGTTGPIGAGGNGQIAAVACQPGNAVAETWTITCTFATTARQEWSVTGSVSGASKVFWKANDYPQAVCFHEQRLFFAGSPSFPQHVWGSAIGDYTNFTLGPLDGDAMAYQIASNSYDAITHLDTLRGQLLIMTYSTELSMGGANNSGISAAVAPAVKAHTFHGSNYVKPIRVGREIVFTQRDGRKPRAISYSLEEDAHIAVDLTLFAEQITEGGTITDFAFAQDPDYVGWAIRSDGYLVSLTHHRDIDQVTGWARHLTDGAFENVATLPGTNYDEVYLVTQRTINSTTKRYLEMFDYDDEVYSDCYMSVTVGSPTTTFTGFSHLEGETVDVVADGVVHAQCVVSSGGITLQDAAETADVGLHYDTTIELLHPEYGDVNSSTQGRKISVHEIIVRLKDTINCQVEGQDIPFRKTTDGVDSVIPPFTGDKSVTHHGWRSPVNIAIKQVTPMPFTLLGVILKANITE